MKGFKAALLIIAGLIFSARTAASASDNWQSIHTAHFNLHFKTPHRAWAETAAIELERVRNKLLQQQDRTLQPVIDVVVYDPLNQANGYALPSSTRPMMGLYITPPQSDSMIANSTGWLQLLVLHEYVHLVHLAQPTRSEWRQTVREMWDLYDLAAADMPRWVAEGYATLQESRLTGRGRLYDNFSEALLRSMARQGDLPRYHELNRSKGRFMAGSMAYLVGSRFLAWLQDKYGADTLDAVWTRKLAVKQRNFEQAFYGAFGEKADRLYRRFIAEYTYLALAAEQTERRDESTLWLDLDMYVSAPAISPSEDRLALVQRDDDGKTRLVVYSTEDNLEAEKAFKQAQQALLKADPEDIPDKPPAVFKRQQKQLLQQINRAGIRYLQWQDESHILFVASSTANDEFNSRHQDLFRWDLASGNVNRLTRFANLRRFTLSRDGKQLFAERVKDGYSELVKVDLASGRIKALFEREFGVVYDYPILSPNSSRLAYLKTTLDKHWQLWVHDIDSAVQFALPAPQGYQYLTHPVWHPDGEGIYFVAARDGETQIYFYDLAERQLSQLGNNLEALGAVTPMQNGGLLYLSFDGEGGNIRYLPVTTRRMPVVAGEPALMRPSKLNRDAMSAPSFVPANQTPKAAAYDIWQQDASLNFGARHVSLGMTQFDFAVKGSDVLKKFNWQLGYSKDLQNNALRGGYAAFAYRAWPFTLKGRVYDYQLDADRLPGEESHGETRRTGGVGEFSYSYRNDQFQLKPRVALGYYDEEGAGANRWARFALVQRWQHDRQDFAFNQSVKIDWYNGKSAGDSWKGLDFRGDVGGKLFGWPVALDYSLRRRINSMLALGGYASGLLPGGVEADRILASELGFYSAVGDKYQGYGGALTIKETMPWLYFRRHRIDNHWFADSYGLKWQRRVDFGFGPAGINDLNMSLGLAHVKGADLNDELRGWLGLWYDL